MKTVYVWLKKLVPDIVHALVIHSEDIGAGVLHELALLYLGPYLIFTLALALPKACSSTCGRARCVITVL